MKTIARFNTEGFTCAVMLRDDGSCQWVADGDIDADGANGQNGGRPAYHRTPHVGSELLGNGGMRLLNGKVVGASSWFDDIVVLDDDGNPFVTPDGVVVSKTAYHFPGFGERDPRRYVDSETVRYIVVPPIIIKATAGAVLGCRVRCRNRRNNLAADGIVADVGPRTKIGEISIAMARALEIKSSPIDGGEDEDVIEYECWPGVPGEIGGKRILLQRFDGSYVPLS